MEQLLVLPVAEVHTLDIPRANGQLPIIDLAKLGLPAEQRAKYEWDKAAIVKEGGSERIAPQAAVIDLTVMSATGESYSMEISQPVTDSSWHFSISHNLQPAEALTMDRYVEILFFLTENGYHVSVNL